MSVRTAQQLAERHARQDHVVGEPRVAGHLAPCVDLGQRLADDREPLAHVMALTGRWPILNAASSTASTIIVSPVQLQMLLLSASRIRCLGVLGTSASR